MLGRSQCWQSLQALQGSRSQPGITGVKFGTREGSHRRNESSQAHFPQGMSAKPCCPTSTAPCSAVPAPGAAGGHGEDLFLSSAEQSYCTLSSPGPSQETFNSTETAFGFKSKQLTAVILGHLYYIFLIFSISWMIKNKLLH